MTKFKNLLFLFLILLPHLALSDVGGGLSRALSETESAVKGTAPSTQCAPELCDSSSIDRTVKKGTLEDPNGSSFELSLITEDYAQELFSHMASQPHIPFGYPEDGCYARAHEMSRLMEKMNVITGKVFIEGDLRVETSNSPKGYVSWWYHVAPVVLVEKDGKQIPYVIDPSVATRAMPEEEWFALQTKHNPQQSSYEYHTKRFNYVPSSKRDSMTDYRPSDIESMNRTMERYLKIQQQRRGQ